MKKIFLFCIILFSFLSSCKKDHIGTVNQLVKDLFCFKENTTWTYYDRINYDTTTILVSEYTETTFGYPKMYGETHNFGLQINFTGETSHGKQIYIGIKSDPDIDNMARVGIYCSPTSYSFSCNKNNTFSCPVTYFPAYEVNGIIYRDVYVFDYKDGLYYVAKHVGYIRCFQANQFDLVLIDKTIYQ
jgi:hypothetical protein